MSRGDTYFWKSYFSGPTTLQSLSGWHGEAHFRVDGELVTAKLTRTEFQEIFGVEVKDYEED
jgi:hypothetical protein